MGAQPKMQGQISIDMQRHEGSNRLDLPLLGVSEFMLKVKPYGACRFPKGNEEELQFSRLFVSRGACIVGTPP